MSTHDGGRRGGEEERAGGPTAEDQYTGCVLYTDKDDLYLQIYICIDRQIYGYRYKDMEMQILVYLDLYMQIWRIDLYRSMDINLSIQTCRCINKYVYIDSYRSIN